MFQGNVTCLRSIRHLHAPDEKAPVKIYSVLAPLPRVQAHQQRFLTPVLAVLNSQLLPYLNLGLTSNTMSMTFSLSRPLPVSNGPFSTVVRMPEWYRFDGTHTLNITIVEEEQLYSPLEKAKTQADVKTDLDALFHLPAAL